MAMLLSVLLHASLCAQVTATGSLHSTMREGQLSGLIDLDTIATPGTYGLGPLEYLQGEILLLDGVCHVSSVNRDGSMHMEQRSDVSAPFFVHAQAEHWEEVLLPDSVTDLPTLDAFLTSWSDDREAPFVFRISATIIDAQVHVMDVPPNAPITSPEDAHRHRKYFELQDEEVDMLGFFSTAHHAVFTHHGSNIHVHLITADRRLMGHLDRLLMDPERMRLEVARP